MKKLFLLLFASIMLCGLVSAASDLVSWDNYAKADLLAQSVYAKYPDIDIIDKSWIGEDTKLATYKLTSHTEQCLIDCYSEGYADMAYDGKLFDKIEFTKLPENYKVLIEKVTEITEDVSEYNYTCKDYKTLEGCETNEIGTHKETKITKEWIQYRGEILKAGTYHWKIAVHKNKDDKIDWIPTAYGKDIPWAWYNTSWQYKRAITFTTLPYVNATAKIYVPVDAHINATGSDLRFTNSTENGEFAYWIKEYNATHFIVYIFINSSMTENNQTFMYYGNPDAPAVSTTLAVTTFLDTGLVSSEATNSETSPAGIDMKVNQFPLEITEFGLHPATTISRCFITQNINNELTGIIYTGIIYGKVCNLTNVTANITAGKQVLLVGDNNGGEVNRQFDGGSATTVRQFYNYNSTCGKYTLNSGCSANFGFAIRNITSIKMISPINYTFGTEQSGAAASTIKVFLVSPANNSNFSIRTVDLKCNATATANLSNITLFSWNGNTELNRSVFTIGTGTNFSQVNLTYVFNTDGNLTWNCWAGDISGNATWADERNRTININATPSVAFELQQPIDISSTNAFGIITNLTYNISLSNTSLVSTFHKTNNTFSDCTYSINGTSICNYIANDMRISNVSDKWNFSIADNQIYPATYNLNETLVEGTAHTSAHLGNNAYAKIQLLNVSNQTNYNIYEIMINRTTTSSSVSSFFYCNSSYTTGSPIGSAFCSNFYSLNNSIPYNHSHSVNSRHMVAPLAINTTYGQVGSVKVTSTSYFVVSGDTSGGWDFWYVPIVSRPDAIQTTSNSGTSWTNQSYTIDSHLHQFNGNDTFWYYVCANATSNSSISACSAVRYDLLNLTGLPPSAPHVYSPTAGINGGMISIAYTAALSPNEYPIMFYNISLLNSDLSFNKTIITNNSNALSYSWDSSTTPNADYVIKVEATDSQNQTSFGLSAMFSLANIIISNSIYNAQTYETAIEPFSVTTDTSQFAGTFSGWLVYNGTFYPAVRTSNNWNVSITIPVGAGTKNIYWSFTNGTAFQNATNISTQIVNPILFSICNSTNSQAYYNLTFKNETVAQENIKAAIISTFVYSLDDMTVNKTYSLSNSTENYGYEFCFSPQNRSVKVKPSLQYFNSISQARNYNPNLLTLINISTNTTLFLLPTSAGQYVTFQILNPAQQVVQNALVEVTNPYSGTESKTSDAAGTATFFMNPTTTYTITVSKLDYQTAILSLAPTQTQYTIVIGQLTTTNITDYGKGITFRVMPTASQLVNQTTYQFNYTINSTFWQLSGFGFTIGNASVNYYSNSSTNALGGSVSRVLNVGTNSTIVMNYYYIANGTIVNGTRIWNVWNSGNTQYSILNFGTDLKNYLTSGMFGLSDFGLTIIIFLIIFVSTGVMAYKFGISSPAAIALIVFVLTLFFDVGLGLVMNPIGAIPHFPTVFVGLILGGLFFKEVTT